jgi:hypothetical protein
MPHLDTGTMLLPFGGRSPRARAASLDGARVAVRSAESQASRILRRYLAVGPQTDLELAAALGLPESRISARRGALVARGWVQWHADIIGPHGARNGRYTLSAAGVAVASQW